jgi:hypothetical protein
MDTFGMSWERIWPVRDGSGLWALGSGLWARNEDFPFKFRVPDSPLARFECVIIQVRL